MDPGANFPSASVTTEDADRGGAWFTRSATDTAAVFGVDPAVGLTAAGAADRQRRYGPNLLAEAPKDPAWKKILRLLADRMTIVLAIAAVVSAVVSHEWKTPVVILAVIMR